MLRGCPECEVSILHREFEDEVEEELRELAVARKKCRDGEEYRWRWSRVKLVQDVAHISNLNSSLDGKGYDPNWPITVKRLIVILREELESFRRVEEKNTQAELDAAMRANNNR